MANLTDEEKYLIAFATVGGIGAARLKLLTNYFRSPQAAWRADRQELAKVGLPKDALTSLLNQRQKLNVDSYVENITKRGIKFVAIDDSLYPQRLKNIPDPPPLLFLKSSLTLARINQLLARKVIAIVGTRQVTSYGREVTEKLTAALVVRGFTIVSGLAIGVDGIAHGTTLNYGGTTIAVMGAGVDVIYPLSHKELYDTILEHAGAVVSEVAPEKRVIRGVFPARNRIISGLCEAVLVTEGAIDSGSLITARAALEQGRDVFAVPGPINSVMAEGTNYLIKQGAKLVTTVEDILEELGYEANLTNLSNLKEPPKGQTSEEQKIIALLLIEPMDFDALVNATKITPSQLASVLSIMEIKGKVKNDRLIYRLS